MIYRETNVQREGAVHNYLIIRRKRKQTSQQRRSANTSHGNSSSRGKPADFWEKLEVVWDENRVKIRML